MPEFVQVNVNVTEEDARMIDRMMVEDAYDNRSAWVRRLIRLEWARRGGGVSSGARPRGPERRSPASPRGPWFPPRCWARSPSSPFP